MERLNNNLILHQPRRDRGYIANLAQERGRKNDSKQVLFLLRVFTLHNRSFNNLGAGEDHRRIEAPR